MEKTFTNDLRISSPWMPYLNEVISGEKAAKQRNYYDDELVSLERKLYEAQSKGACDERKT